MKVLTKYMNSSGGYKRGSQVTMIPLDSATYVPYQDIYSPLSRYLEGVLYQVSSLIDTNCSDSALKHSTW